jgi:hypothetical protein
MHDRIGDEAPELLGEVLLVAAVSSASYTLAVVRGRLAARRPDLDVTLDSTETPV